MVICGIWLLDFVLVMNDGIIFKAEVSPYLDIMVLSGGHCVGDVTAQPHCCRICEAQEQVIQYAQTGNDLDMAALINSMLFLYLLD